MQSGYDKTCSLTTVTLRAVIFARYVWSEFIDFY